MWPESGLKPQQWDDECFRALKICVLNHLATGAIKYNSNYCMFSTMSKLFQVGEIGNNQGNIHVQKWPHHSCTYTVQEDHWSCIAHLSAKDMLKSAVIEEKKFEHSRWAGADNPLGSKFLCQQEGFIIVVICCKFKKNLFNLWLYTHFFMI